MFEKAILGIGGAMKIAVSLAVAVPLLAGCASTQLNYNTLEISGTVDDLLASQISHNLAKFLRDKLHPVSGLDLRRVGDYYQSGGCFLDRSADKGCDRDGRPTKNVADPFCGYIPPALREQSMVAELVGRPISFASIWVRSARQSG